MVLMYLVTYNCVLDNNRHCNEAKCVSHVKNIKVSFIVNTKMLLHYHVWDVHVKWLDFPGKYQ